MSFIGSRSPSPSKIESKKREINAEDDGGSPRASRLLKKDDLITSNPNTVLPAPPRPDLAKRRSTFTGPKPSDKENTKPAPRPVRNFLHKSFSTDKLHSVVEFTHDDSVPLPSPRLFNTERNGSALSLSLPKKRDELWGVFRSLDGDFTKFSAKSTPFKANVIRQCLLPFLRNYADHPSNYHLRAEDLDRRVVILNKWWVGLIELVHGRNNQSMSGTDRPTILDALSGLMDRPEWRPSPSVFCPLSRRTSDSPASASRSKSDLASLASSGSDFLNESVLHNVRNLFVQNLNAQMAFVAEKMSLRNAAASLITFCGKAIAWAFFYCPGIADVLVREWLIDADSMKRVLQVHGISKFENLKDTSEEMALMFPPAIRSLAFTTLSKMTRSLKEEAELPAMSASMEMYGYWRDRWLGRESDLLYVFVKHFFILAHDYLPADAEKMQRIASPGMLVVQAQILINIDSTINRDVSSSQENSTSPSPTFDDFLGGPDAVVSSLPILPPNAVRIMSENRLIMLIRDFLSDRVAEHSAARHLFAISFCDLLSACARGTSTFNHAACYTLCDLLEEALVILTRYEQSPICPAPVIDFNFWLDVFRKMLGSHNTVTEIRVFAFLYTSWNQLCSDPKRKEDLCLNLLLAKDVFETTFLHWCPMVRAYYMRLLCWRVARYDGEATEVDIKILETAFERLRSLWAYHLFDREKAESEGRNVDFFAPCNPAPGRRFLIVRTDTQIAPGGAFLAFNGIIPPSPVTTPETRPATILAAENLDRPLSIASNDSDGLSPDKEETGIRGFFRGIMGARKRSQSRDKKTTTPTKPPTTTAKATDDSANRPRDRQALTRAPPPAPTYRNYCFKFSLEFLPRPQGPRQAAKQQPQPMKLMAPRLPMAAQKFLQEREPDLPAEHAASPSGTAQIQYVGRALAEWTVIVSECQGFFDRRKSEGVPSDKEVETPTMGVELFRRNA
ncbi:DUF1765-domain-containing protein [Myriangium duriaei CBS 260.36]|uniref:DUF1765-domain-containing protein n=1 Tax=Myriangium duriaei CBS 260.36 TaxID=1168546 RepID=A0A9P4IPF6_9PEZI|nr:DUF1765-domain-containing protein [Myriangium duriaei CBS 260.36]